MTISVEQIQNVTGRGKVVTEGGDKVGDIGQLYLNDKTGAPAWVTVKTGLLGTGESFVPLDGARVEGDDVVVGFDKDTIKAAPRVDADGSITPDEEQSLYRHYGLTSPGDEVDERDTDRVHAGVTSDRNHTDDVRAGQRSDRDDDDAITRSEERLKVGTQTHVSGRAVLRKHVVTEYVTQTVPVRREEVRIEREPITDANRGDIVDDGDVFGEDGDLFEVILHQEVPVVQTETVAVERVRLRKATLTDQATVSEDVRKEQLDLDDPTRQARE